MALKTSDKQVINKYFGAYNFFQVKVLSHSPITGSLLSRRGYCIHIQSTLSDGCQVLVETQESLGCSESPAMCKEMRPGRQQRHSVRTQHQPSPTEQSPHNSKASHRAFDHRCQSPPPKILSMF